MTRTTMLGAAVAAITTFALFAGMAPQTAPGDAPTGPAQRDPRGPGTGQNPGAGRPGARGGAGALPPNFEQGMKQAGRGFRALKASALDAATRDADLAAVQALQTGLLASKGVASTVPMSPSAKQKFGDDETAYRAALRRDLIKALRQSFDLEDAILEGKTDAAKASMAKLEEKQESGHTLFQSEE